MDVTYLKRQLSEEFTEGIVLNCPYEGPSYHQEWFPPFTTKNSSLTSMEEAVP